MIVVTDYIDRYSRNRAEVIYKWSKNVNLPSTRIKNS